MKCHDGIQCIHELDLCDRHIHCNDKSDEDEDMCKGEVLAFQFCFLSI